MEVLYPHCAGLDVHKDTVVACVRQWSDGDGRGARSGRFKTTTERAASRCRMAGGRGLHPHRDGGDRASTGSRSGTSCQRGDFELMLANAAHVKNVPGRKTDVNDATWLADLLAHGLIRGSFVPDAQTQELRGLLRTRKQLVRERTSHIQRLQKTLEDANIKLDSVITDIIGPVGPAHDRGADRRRDRSRQALAGAGASADQGHARRSLREALRGRVTQASSLPAAAASPADRCARCGHRRDRSGGRRQRRALSRSDRQS